MKFVKLVVVGHIWGYGRILGCIYLRKTLMQMVYGRIWGSGRSLRGRSWQGPLYTKLGVSSYSSDKNTECISICWYIINKKAQIWVCICLGTL